MKKKYQELEMEMVYFDTGTEVHTCEFVEACPQYKCPEVACLGYGCRTYLIPICKCDNDIIHASGE